MTTATFTPTSSTAMTAIVGTGFLNPITNAETEFANAGWTVAQIADVQSSNNVYATAAPANGSSRGQLFLFSTLASTIPAGSTINSCSLIVEKKYSTTSSGGAFAIAAFESQANGVPATKIGYTKDGGVNAENTTDADLTLDLGALGITAAQLRGANFCVGGLFARQSLTGYTGSVDYIRLVIDWTPPASGGGRKGKAKGGVKPVLDAVVDKGFLSIIVT